MAMSKRRLQFLNQLVGMYKKQHVPVHYEALAKEVGVSKWTAYDMLKEIEKSGYVTRSYEVNPNETGRSQVVFAPTEKAAELLEQPRSNDGDPEKWEESLQSLRDLLHNKWKHTNVQDLIKTLMDEMPQKRSNLEFCGSILGILIIYLKKIGGKAEEIIKRLIKKTAVPGTSLLMFVGTVLGTVIQTMSDEISGEIAELASSYVKLIGDLSQNEQQLLSDFVHEALA
ncbi:DNA-binding protein [Paenibacillus oryzae]|uniref:DNA-binding protein n=1 Tax=Paenibacillus oryzae TaxID=1844972 RepID=A0A1A5YPW7_9BACL|nr:DNA-binding protein [Paenibacillus oryzae]OBR67644.1 DNA-binding protein [Paenibacillus oryzae]